MTAQPPATEPTTRPASISDVEFEREVLGNGLTVIYAPMDNAPVVHVRVLYQVGSKDERPERQGFAHMFEHMMFRGSAHVPPERHMQLINATGGDSNAFTSFDQTTYTNTVPSNHLEMALYLEADRMASFVVTPEIFDTERQVVAEEWRLRTANPPYGEFFQDMFDLAFDNHYYQWMPIGDMEHLAAAQPAELQAFHDEFYVPNNATLVIAGDFDVAQAKAWVERYYGWIEKGDEVVRRSPSEPPQTEPRRAVVTKGNIPLPRIALLWKTVPWADDDQYALDVLGSILGDGRSSRMYQALVAGESPIANVAQAGNEQLEDVGLFFAVVGLLPDADPDAAEAEALAVVERIAEEGPTAEEVEKAKTQFRLSLINRRATADSVGTDLGEYEVFGGDAGRINSDAAKIAAVTAEDVQRVAQEHLKPTAVSILHYVPGQPAEGATDAEQAAADILTTQPVEDDSPVEPRAVNFPEDYPVEPPFSTDALAAEFEKGSTFDLGGVKVIVLPDDRLPTVAWNLVLPAGGHAVEPGKEGLAGVTASLLTRGVAGYTAAEFARELDSRGIRLNVTDNGDHTIISGRSTRDQLAVGLDLTRRVATVATLDDGELAKLKAQVAAGLAQQLASPGPVASRQLDAALYGDSPLGTNATPETVAKLTKADVQAWYDKIYQPTSAMLLFAGDITEATARDLAADLLADWQPKDVAEIDLNLPEPATTRRVILIDNPDAQQATVRLARRAYDNQSDARFAGSVASQILSNGIDSRMNRVLRAEQGLTYGAAAYFSPNRADGRFLITVDTRPETAGQAVDAALGVIEEMRQNPVTSEELARAQQIVSGAMVMATQTIDQQAGRRVNIELNDYPLDYYDTLPARINEVTLADVQEVMQTHADPQNLTLIIVGPAGAIRPQVEQHGEVTLLPMPAKR